jgi:hypothetical protein
MCRYQGGASRGMTGRAGQAGGGGPPCRGRRVPAPPAGAARPLRTILAGSDPPEDGKTDFLKFPALGSVLTTIRRNGLPQLSNVSHYVSDDHVVRLTPGRACGALS